MLPSLNRDIRDIYINYKVVLYYGTVMRELASHMLAWIRLPNSVSCEGAESVGSLVFSERFFSTYMHVLRFPSLLKNQCLIWFELNWMIFMYRYSTVSPELEHSTALEELTLK